MANVKQEPTTTNAGDRPNVEVYDTGTGNTGATTTGATDTARDMRTTTTGPRFDDTPPARSGTNWGTILLVLLIVIALVLLAMWLF